MTKRYKINYCTFSTENEDNDNLSNLAQQESNNHLNILHDTKVK